jgi:hypothetical protein
MDAVILPNGKILALNGSTNDEDATTASLNADLYDPNANTFSSAGVATYPRLYHSGALLLPNATVLVLGGNPVRGTYEPHLEIYTPAYLFNSDGSPATQPTITSVTPGVIGYGGSFQIQTPNAANISSVVLVRAGSPTHAFDMDQRLVGLNFTAGNGVLNATAPPNGSIAPPGYYLLFILNSAGVPSVAQFVQLSLAPTDQPPTGIITNPSSNVTINPGQSVSFAGTGTSANSTIAAYSWMFPGGNPTSSSLANPGAVTYPASAPMITSENPTAGPVGTLVTITAAPTNTYVASLTVTDSLGVTDPSPPTRTITLPGGFGSSQGTSTVTFNGVAATPTSWTSTSITVPVPNGASSGSIVVTVGGVASNGVGFTVTASTPPPSITSLNPTSGSVGTGVTITGTYFGTSGTVTFNGTVATTTSWSATSIVTSVPTGATSGNVVVTVGGMASNTIPFTVTSSAAPAITSASSASGTMGTAFSYKITATNSPTSYGASGLPSWASVNTSTGVISGTPTAAGTSTVTVSATNAGGTGSATLTITVSAAPVITSANSVSLLVGTAGSFTVTATGSPTPSLMETGALPSPVTFKNNGNGTATLSGTPAAGTAGSYPITITASNGVGTAATQSFTLIVNPGPDFSMVANPASITISKPGQPGSTSLMLSAMNGLNGSFNLVPQCASLPSESTCSVSPTSVTFSSTIKTASIMLTVTTTAPSSVAPNRNLHSPGAGIGTPIAISLIALSSLLGLLRTRRKFEFVLTAIVFAALFTFATCGGGSGGGVHDPGTPVGLDPNASVSLTLGSATHSIPFSVNVQ